MLSLEYQRREEEQAGTGIQSILKIRMRPLVEETASSSTEQGVRSNSILVQILTMYIIEGKGKSLNVFADGEAEAKFEVLFFYPVAYFEDYFRLFEKCLTLKL